MSFEKAKADLEEKGLGDHVIVLNESSATVAEAAHALGVEPASIAKTLSVLQGEKPVLIVTVAEDSFSTITWSPKPFSSRSAFAFSKDIFPLLRSYSVMAQTRAGRPVAPSMRG